MSIKRLTPKTLFFTEEFRHFRNSRVKYYTTSYNVLFATNIIYKRNIFASHYCLLSRQKKSKRSDTSQDFS